MDKTPKLNITDNQPDDSNNILINHKVTFTNFEWDYIKATTTNALPTCRNCHTAT